MAEVVVTKLKINLIFFALEFNITRILKEIHVLLTINLFLPRRLPALMRRGLMLFGISCLQMPSRNSWKPPA